ncbi:carboxypeptidase M32 [Rhodobacteraceae bacterium CCMM004]|nr:carboxypeptidase M32 [Rhodobacteraceae bacterium CCMM004]
MTAYDDLMSFQRETEALGQIAGRLMWDQETMMPPGAAEQRGEEMAAIEHVLHARRTDPRVGDWLATAEPADALAEAQLRLIRRRYERSARVPARLAAEIARVTSVAQGKWAAARAAEDVAAFAPVLAQVVALRREEGAALADGGDVYDALLEDYEPGATAQSLAAMFDGLRPRLVALRDRCLGAEAQPPTLTGEFGEAAQLDIARELAAAFGYDFHHGRIDKAVHPFSSGSGTDVRITTRTSAADPFNCFYSTIHEVGHAAYEQGVDDAYLLTPVGQGVSMGVHESQSRIYENQLGRSRGFTHWLHGRMVQFFGDLGMDEPAFYGAVNRLHRGYIRTEADEVQYNLHVMLRFDLERELIAGRLAPEDLEEAWNARFAADFGYPVDKPSNGCLQDVHWSVGLFGYFPTYSLGNVYAGCLHAAMRRDLPDLDAALERGDPSPATHWLRDNLQCHGGLRSPRDTIAHATGAAPSEAPLLDYLDDKFAAIYRL